MLNYWKSRFLSIKSVGLNKYTIDTNLEHHQQQTSQLQSIVNQLCTVDYDQVLKTCRQSSSQEENIPEIDIHFPVVAVGFVEKTKQFLDPSSISRPVAEEIWGMCLYLFTGQDVYLKLN